MHRGFTKSYRKELDSSIWKMPPLYHRVWFWLRQSVNFKTNLVVTTNGYGIYVLPGQRLTSFQQISLGVKYYENKKVVVPDRKTILRILKWLEHHQMIMRTSHDSGTLITVVNWHVYNGPPEEPATEATTGKLQIQGQGQGPRDGQPQEYGHGCKQEGSIKENKNNCEETFFDSEFDAFDPDEIPF